MLRRYWNLHKNKILAVGFASLAIAVFLAEHVFITVQFGWGYYKNSPFTVFNILLTLFVYVFLLVTNIQNDDRAYSAIHVFLFFIVYDMVWAFLPTGFNVISAFQVPWPWFLFSIIMAIGVVATGVFGVFSYINLFRYRIGRIAFEKTWRFIWLFTLSFVAYSLVAILLMAYMLGGTGTAVTYAVLAFLPDALLALSVLFTVLRLRRF